MRIKHISKYQILQFDPFFFHGSAESSMLIFLLEDILYSAPTTMLLLSTAVVLTLAGLLILESPSLTLS